MRTTTLPTFAREGTARRPGATLLDAYKSTNVRASLAFPIARAWLPLIRRFAPSAASHWASRRFLTPPPARPLSPKAREVFSRAADTFNVKFETDAGGEHFASQLRVTVWGRGPAVYFVHGWGGRGGQWSAFVDPLVAAGKTVVVFDAPGHGDSPAPRTSVVHFAAALETVVESVGPAHGIVGHSLGAAACAFAVSRGLAAGRVVFLGAPANPAGFFDAFLQRLEFPTNLSERTKADVEKQFGFRWTDLTIAPPAGVPAPPALVVHDDDDQDVSPGDADRITRGWPSATLMTTGGLGHQRILRDDAVVKRVVQFLADPQVAPRASPLPV